jgi:hypothetical protein
VVEGSPLILRNDGTRNHWIGISLAGAKSNRHGLGARVVLTETSGRQQVYEVTSAGSYLSSNDPRAIFGLGAGEGVKAIEVIWPGGQAQKISNPGIDRYLTMSERDAAPKGKP